MEDSGVSGNLKKLPLLQRMSIDKILKQASSGHPFVCLFPESPEMRAVPLQVRAYGIVERIGSVQERASRLPTVTDRPNTSDKCSGGL